MTSFIQFIEQAGIAAVDFFWLPVAIWTVLSLMVAMLLKYNENLAAVYKYHFCIAISAALPIGIITAGFIPKLFETTEQTFAAPFFVIQNPVSAYAGSTTQAGLGLDPAFWVGLATLLVAFIALAGIIKLCVHFIQLRLFINEVKAEGYSTAKAGYNISVLFSDQVEIPCTFGWFAKKIVLPADLKNDSENYKMALRHELTHIQNYDNVINNLLQAVKALFTFHPLVHYFTRKTDEYREICCDLHVLTDPDISQKKYAELLFELSSKQNFKQSAAVNMAVNPSTLKKRIQIMKKQAKTLPSVKRSMAVTLLLAFTFIGFMACSDVTDNGLTVGEVKEVQQKANNSTIVLKGEDAPLIVLNGEIVPQSDGVDILGRLKPKYIKSINILKNKPAVEAYGQKGKNGVIEIELLDKELALNDLRSDSVTIKKIVTPSGGNGDVIISNDVFIGVQDMPQLKTSRAELQSHVEYPESCYEAGIDGTVIVQFVVQPTGDLTDFSVVKGIGGGCDQAAIEAIKKYAEFTPGEQNGEKVPVRMSFPIAFRLQ